MARNSLQVEVMEETANDERRITITIIGAREEFQLADLLAQRKAIQPSAAVLKRAALEAIQGYLESAEEVISGVKAEQKKESDDAPLKRGRKSKEPGLSDEVPTMPTRKETINGPIATTAFSGD